MKLLFCTALLFLLQTNINAQTIDSITVARDTTIELSQEPSPKVATAAGIIIPTTMIVYSIVQAKSDVLEQVDFNTKNELLEDNQVLNSHLSDYLQFAPAAGAFTLKLSGVKSQHKFSDMLIIYALSNLVESGVVYGTKQIVGRPRPDGSGNNSFPSGHTATAFVAAEFLHQEYRDQSIWISIGGYATASVVGVLRVYNNRHWISDVIAGAGIGILCTKGVYWLYPELQKVFGCSSHSSKRGSHAFILPSYNDGMLGLSFSYSF